MNKDQPEDGERSDDAPLVAESESFGTWLRRQREVREIDLREIADSSKVSMSYLHALEEDRFEVLPAPLFAKGFLRQYARYVGLDPEEVVNFYLAARHPEGEEEPSLQPQTAPEPPSRNYVLIALAITVALVLVVWLLSFLNERLRSAPAQPPDQVQEEASLPPAAAEVEPAAAMVVTEPTPAPESLVVAKEGPEEQVAVEGPIFPLRVTLDFMSDCWVEAAVDGERKISELKVQGESLLLDAEEVVEFKVGDVGAVQVEVNGSPFAIGDRVGTSVRTVRIDLDTAASLAAGEAPSSAASVRDGD
ncbi:MAG: DUF4115 domain-containing protein [bacterium]|nr:DUF4115 domain-containing protein [bacterium]